ncbi:hypothetical protein NUU61_007683 [Penicillium alfredii]|uniref:F-box domain-containing protein n=1 Tax=Penicillium alfredii TaxID=1506179 RepID=A0A9W9ER25_9EURO|nr:uncharacterized protein NUU61_007683 [Penicillium alfredii]KAJ5086376.1 hypothetical protein NUU61_007683 [Penicillium alfredii]
MESAQDTALATAEVLENILLGLDLTSLLTSAQRVCHSWHNLVSTSPSLQKHLFLQPDWQKRHKTWNPLLSARFPHWFPPTHTESQANEDNCHIEGGGTLLEKSDFEKLPLAQPDTIASFMYKNASWRRMLVQQPPVLDLAVFRVWYFRGGCSLKGPYIQQMLRDDESVQYLYSQSLAASKPLRMDSFFDQVMQTRKAIPTQWMILWDTGVQQIPSTMDDYTFDLEEKQILREALAFYGMILVVCQTKQCKSPFLWIPGEKFMFPDRSLDISARYIRFGK